VLTDLVQIKLLGEKKRDENLRFRKHMKAHDHSDRVLRRIALEVEDSLGGHAEEVTDLLVTGIPDMPVMVGILNHHFVRAHGVHAVVEAVSTASGLTFDVVQGFRVNDGTRGPILSGSIR